MSQADRLYNLLKDGQPHRTDEILRVVYGGDHLGIARISARIKDLKEGKWSGKTKCDIKPAWADKERPTLSWYQMIVEAPQVIPPQKRIVDRLYNDIKANQANMNNGKLFETHPNAADVFRKL